MKRDKRALTLILTILAALLSALTGILGNLAASTPLPPVFIPYLHFAWLAFGIVVVLGIFITVWQSRQQDTPDRSTHSSGGHSMQPNPLPPSQQGQPSGPLFSCFISYSSHDHAFAEQLHTDLEQHGGQCWFAPHDMKIGDKIRQRIEDSIQAYDKLLLVLSEHSVESAWVESEVETAFEKERQQKRLVLFPIRLDETVMQTRYAWAADIRRTRHIGDFRGWTHPDAYQKAFDRLLRDLQV